MGDNNARQVQLDLEAFDEIPEQLRHQRIDHRRGLVVKHALRTSGQGTGDGDGALHPSRKIRGQQVAHLLHPDHLQQAIDDLVGLLFIQFARFAQREGYILADGQRVKERSVLKNHGDFFPNQFHLRIGVVGDVLSSDDDASGVWLEKAHDGMQRDRLAHAAAA